MNRFERELRESLKHREPPADFAEKVVARAYATGDSRSVWFSRTAQQWLVAAAVALMVGGGFFYQQEQRRRAENERTKEQLIVGLQITSSKLRRVQVRLEVIQKRTKYLHPEQ